MGDNMLACGLGGDRFGPDRSTVRLAALARVAGRVEIDAVGEDRVDRLLERGGPARAVAAGLWRREVAERAEDVEAVPDRAVPGEFRNDRLDADRVPADLSVPEATRECVSPIGSAARRTVRR